MARDYDRITVSLTERQKEWLDDYAEQTGDPLDSNRSRAVREAIDLLRARETREVIA